MNRRLRPVILFLLSVFFSLSLLGFSFTEIETAILEKNFEKAEAITKDMIARQPKSSPGNFMGRSPSADLDQAYYYLGLSQMGLKKYAEARETFNTLITQNPAQPFLDKAYLGVIDSHLLDNDYRNALTVSEALLKLNPKSELLSLIYLKLARANLKLARWEKAREYLAKITHDFPDSLEFHLAKQLLEEKQFFTVQVGSFLSRERAENLANQLKEKGEYAYVIETLDHEGRKFYRVRLGQFSALEQAQNLQQELSKLGYPTHIYP